MNVKLNKWLFAILALIMASVALADPVEDMELAEKAIKTDDLPKAMEFLHKAALQNYTPAMVRYAEILDYADADEMAVFWLKIAVEQGSAAAETGLGGMYLKGEGVKQDTDKAFYWIRHAAEQDYVPAMELLSSLYRAQAQYMEEKAAWLKEKAAAEKADAEKAAVEKAAVEKVAVEKAAVEKAAVEKAAVEKAADKPVK